MEPSQPTSELVHEVLREHVAFLREQLDEKRSWFQEIQDILRVELQEAKREVVKLSQENLKLKTALAQATCEAKFHNENDDRNHTTDEDAIAYWETLFHS